MVGRDGIVHFIFDLLQHWVRLAIGKGVRGQQQQGDLVDCSIAGCRDQVQGTGANRSRTGVDGPAAVLLGIGHAGMGDVLFILALDKPDFVPVLVQSLAEADSIAMAEDTHHAMDKFGFLTIDLNVLVIQKQNQCLGHCQFLAGVHAFLLQLDAAFAWQVVVLVNLWHENQSSGSLPGLIIHAGLFRGVVVIFWCQGHFQNTTVWFRFQLSLVPF